MTTEIIQVRDVPTEDARVLRARAAAQNISFSAYLRQVIHADAARPTMSEVLERIAQRVPVDVDGDTIRASIEYGRSPTSA